MRQQRITCLWLTAGLFNQIVDERPAVLASVRHVLAGGDALSMVHVHRALEMFPTLRLTNGYGPTEVTTFSCTHPIDRDTLLATSSVPIGRPIANTCCYILDAHSHPVPIGVAGELYVGGDGLAHGYLNLPELTAERFVPHPFSAEPGARLYRTGDMARYLSDGTIEFLGRRDQQVKIRGFRIELGEIESALETHPDVQACAVVVHTVAGHEKRLRPAWCRASVLPCRLTDCGPGCASDCPITCSPRDSSSWMPCRSHSMERWIARRSRICRAATSLWARASCRPARKPNARCAASGKTCSACDRSESTTASSTWADNPSWRSARSAGSIARREFCCR